VGDKVHSQEGNSPEEELRTLIFHEMGKEDLYGDGLGGGLGSSHPLKKA